MSQSQLTIESTLEAMKEIIGKDIVYEPPDKGKYSIGCEGTYTIKAAPTDSTYRYRTTYAKFSLKNFPGCCAASTITGIHASKPSLYPHVFDLIALTLKKARRSVGIYTHHPTWSSIKAAKEAGIPIATEYINHRYAPDRVLCLLTLHAYEHVERRQAELAEQEE